MRSFRLYVGERNYLTAAGWASLALAGGVTLGVGYFGAKWLTDLFGPAGVSRAVAGVGVGTWLLALALFRVAGFPLIARLTEEGTTGPAQDAEPGAAADRGGR
jgi:hypothetical protein